MKFSVAILLSVVALIQGAAIETAEDIRTKLVSPATLFEQSWIYQARLTALQDDINEQLTAIRTAVSTVLKSSSNETLAQIENNSDVILAMDKPTRDILFDRALTATKCIINLRVLINGITEFTGFGSSNCVTSYDLSVQGALNNASNVLRGYEGNFGDVQQIVVRSFIGYNGFTEPEEIEDRFIDEFNRRDAEWQAIRPNVVGFISDLRSKIDELNSVLGSCFKNIQDEVAPGYGILAAQLQTCTAFDNTADPFAMFRA